MGGVGITTGMKKVLDLAAKARTAGKATGSKRNEGSAGAKRASGSSCAPAAAPAPPAPSAPSAPPAPAINRRTSNFDIFIRTLIANGINNTLRNETL